MLRVYRSWPIVAGLLLLLAAPRLTAQERPVATSAEDSVRAIEMARREALLHADTVALSRMTADEFIEISRFGTLRTKADNIREIASGGLRLTTVKYDSLNVRVYGDMAILYGIADNTGMMRGMPFGGKIRYMRIFVRREGRWQAVAMQHTPMP
jgi:ketosteroid isomerase-like protein